MKVKSVCTFITIVTVVSRLMCIVAIPITRPIVPMISIVFATGLIIYGSYLLAIMRLRLFKTIRFIPYFLCCAVSVIINKIICISRYLIYFNIWEQGIMGGILDVLIYGVLIAIIAAAYFNKNKDSSMQKN